MGKGRYLEGTKRADTIEGTRHADVIEGHGGNDRLYGGDGDDSLFGGAGKDRLYGGDGDDFLLGGAGADRYSGGAGYDTISFSDACATRGVVANLATGKVENDGFGNAETLSGIEGFSGGTLFADRFTGDDGANGFFLDTRDRAAGGGGDDSFTVGGAAAIDGGKGHDTVSFTGQRFAADGDGGIAVIGADRGVNVQLGLGTYSDGFGESASIRRVETVIGTRFADTLTGGEENNILVGGDGRDLLQGSGGDDTLWGEGGRDTLVGGDGRDWLFGEDGRDFLSGSDGADTLVGGAGRDTLTGETGGDLFLFEDGHAGATRAEADYITDFSQQAGDRIDLTCVDAKQGGKDDAFRFIGDDAFSGRAGELRFMHDGSDIWVIGDTDGDKGADLMIRIDFAGDLTQADFIL